MKRLAVIPSDKIQDYLNQGYSSQWLRDYYNPGKFFDEVYLLSNLESDQDDLLGMKVIHTKPQELPKRLKELNIDVVRAYGGNWACRFACDHKVPGVPVVVSVHDSSPFKLYDSIKHADMVWCMSNTVKDLVFTKFNHQDRVGVLPNRVDMDLMRPLTQEDIGALDQRFPFKYKILHVGRLSKEKNLDTLIKALALLGEDYGLVVIGHGHQAPYKNQAQQLKVDGRMTFIDAVTHEELARYYTWCTCMCTPSRREGFGMVFIEALACNSVVVTSNIAPLNEYIKDGINGILINDIEDPQALAKMIEKACTDEVLRAKIKGVARESVLPFEKESIETQEINFYKKVLDMKNRGEFNDSYRKALAWIKHNTIPEKGIIVNTKERISYLEVTGYLIPTLIAAQEWDLARSYADFLAYMQLPDGSFKGPDGKKYVFDSGQALRGLIAAAQQWPEFKEPAIKTADYILKQMEPSGRIQFNYEENIPEYVHLFVLPPLVETGLIFKRAEYIDAAQNSVSYYKKQPQVLSSKHLTHFLGYILDGFIDMGEADFVRPFVTKLFDKQGRDGKLPAYSGVNWVCSVGIAQLAIVGYKLGFQQEADRLVDYVSLLQNPSGGFYGSYGFRAKYFPKTEISWANKFFLDAIHLKQGLHPSLKSTDQQVQALNDKEWHTAIKAGRTVEEIAATIKRNDFPVWCKPLLKHTQADQVILELGSGTGELAAILSLYARRVQLIDYSADNNAFAQQLFEKLGITAGFHCHDITKPIPLENRSVDWVYSSGVLEHFSDKEIISILKESKRLARQGVMSLVPNANAIFYRVGKSKMEREGNWKYGYEDPKWTMRPLFEEAGLNHIHEYSVGTYHALEFWGKSHEDIKHFLETCSLEQLQRLNQGYLLFTIGIN